MELSDILIIALGGLSLGFIIPGLLGVFFDAPDGKLCITVEIFAGAAMEMRQRLL